MRDEMRGRRAAAVGSASRRSCRKRKPVLRAIVSLLSSSLLFSPSGLHFNYSSRQLPFERDGRRRRN